MIRFFAILLSSAAMIVLAYRILDAIAWRVRGELDETQQDLNGRAAELKQKKQKLKRDCAQEAKSAQKRAKTAQKIQTKL